MLTQLLGGRMARRQDSTANADRLKKAGVLPPAAHKKLTAKHHRKLGKLTRREVDAIIRIHKKVGTIRVKAGKVSHAFAL